MARVSGVDLPKNKRVVIALTYLHGIGRKTSEKICHELKIKSSLRTDDLTDHDVAKIRTLLQNSYKIEGDLRQETSMAKKRLMDLNCYRGIRHKKGLTVRGQNTRTNCRTRKGAKKTVANKKTATK